MDALQDMCDDNLFYGSLLSLGTVFDIDKDRPVRGIGPDEDIHMKGGPLDHLIEDKAQNMAKESGNSASLVVHISAKEYLKCL